MPDSIDIAQQFEATRERTVLEELLRVVRALQAEGIEGVVCGGWVPFLKQLARDQETAHSMSLDIDLMLRESARQAATIDRIKALLTGSMEFQPLQDKGFRFEKKIDGNVVQLDLLTDLPRTDDDPIHRIRGIQSSLDLCIADGADQLGTHIEKIQITWKAEAGAETSEITVPDPVGFLMLKAEVSKWRQEGKDIYDLYYYCRYSEAPEVIRAKLEAAIDEPAVRAAVDRLQVIFGYADSQFIEMALDHMEINGDERDREAQFIVRAMRRVVHGL